MSYVAFDLETTGSTTYDRFCNPLDPRHSITMAAFKLPNQDAIVHYNELCYKTGLAGYEVFDKIDLSKVKLIICHHARFDLLWVWKDLTTWIQNGGRIWCTMLAEFLLRGQQGVAHGSKNLATSLSLDALTLKYGGTLKDSRIGEMFKAGIKANEIDPEILIPYNKWDVKNTELIYLAQVKEAKLQGMIPLIQTNMNHLMALIEMEYNGLYIDKEILEERIKDFRERREIQLNIFKSLSSKYWTSKDTDNLPDINIQSVDNLRTLFFGGEVSYNDLELVRDETNEVIIYKTGKKAGHEKTRKVVKKASIPGMRLNPFGLSKTDGGKIQLDKEALTLIRSKNPALVDCILTYRRICKLLNTYLENDAGDGGMKRLIHPDGCIHTSYSTTNIPTGRISSTKPNVQNLDPDILDIFVAGEDTDLVYSELDFSQIEVIVQAYLTQDKQFLDDILSGKDFHCIRLQYMEPDKTYEEIVELCKSSKEYADKRKKAKTVTFSKQYGGGIATIAANAGLPEETVKEIFEKEDLRYPDIKNYYDNLLEEIKSNTTPTEELIQIREKNGYYTRKKGEHARKSFFRSLTGKKYVLDQLAVRTKTGEIFRYWHDPTIKNFPIQGTANDIFELQVGELFVKHAIFNRNKYLLRNEIHDSITITHKKDDVEWIKKEVVPLLKDVQGNMKKRFGLVFDIPIGVDIKTGRSLKNCKE